jgi:hypothetical protein
MKSRHAPVIMAEMFHAPVARACFVRQMTQTSVTGTASLNSGQSRPAPASPAPASPALASSLIRWRIQ